MEDILGFIVVLIGAIGAIIGSASKKKQQAQRQYPPIVSAPAQPQAAPAVVTPHDVPMQVAQPTVHTHLAPDCDVHDASGSLAFRSTEGKDPCHEEQLRQSHEPLYEPSTQPGLTLDWTGDSMVKAFVMQEVLTRPSQRRAR